LLVARGWLLGLGGVLFGPPETTARGVTA